MTFKPKLVAFDLDGTLAESKQRMTQQMGELLAALLGKMPVAVMSGAAFHQYERQFLPALPDDAALSRLFLFPTNAAQCYAFEAGQWRTRYDHSFTELERKKIHEAITASLAVVDIGEKPQPEWGEQVEDRSAQITLSVLGQKAPLEKKQSWNSLRAPTRKALRDAIAQRLPEFSVSMGGLTSIDITRQGINKTYGIRRLVEISGISVSEMLYVGDAFEEGGNDAVVVESGVKTRPVLGPEETAAIIKEVLAAPAFAH